MATFTPMPSTSVDLASRVKVASARIEQALFDVLSPRRREHVMGVASYAEWLAMRFGEDPARARLAALGHDVAREWDEARIREWALSDGFGESPLERELPKLLHGRAAAVVLRDEYHVCDEEVLAAVRSHTLGDTGMTRLQKVLYCADYLEPQRAHVESEFRAQVEPLGLDAMLCACVDHNTRRGHEPADPTLAMYRELCGKEYPG